MSQSIWKDGIGKGDGGTAPEAGAGGTFHMPEFGRLESDRKTEVLIVESRPQRPPPTINTSVFRSDSSRPNSGM